MERPPPFRSLCTMQTPEAVATTKAEGAEQSLPKGDSAPATQGGLEELKRLRQQQIELLSHAAANDPTIVNGLIARVQSLSAAIELIEKAKNKARDRRIAVSAWVAAVLLTGTLLLLHRPSAEIVTDARSSQLWFSVTAPFAPLRGVAQVASVELTGLAKIRREGVPEVAAEPDEDLHLRIQPDLASKSPGSIGFDPLIIPAGTEVELTQTGSGTAILMRFQYPSGASPVLDLDVTGDVVIRLNGQQRVSFPAPVRITAVPAADAQLIVEFGSREVTFPTPVPVGSVSWNRDARSASVHPGGARNESSILSGKLSLEEFKDRSVNLRNGELLHLGEASGQIRQLRSDGEALSSQFDGAVKELSTGEGNREQNLMPTWLEWLRQRDALVQFWALAGYLAALGLAAARWWGESK